MRKIFASQVEIGMRLPCDVYNSKGVLLWAQNAQVKTEQQVRKLVTDGYRSDLQEWIPANIGSKVDSTSHDENEIHVKIKKTFVYKTVLDALTEIQLPLIYIFDVFKTDSFFKEKQPLTTQINSIVDVILDICEKHQDEAFATIHMHTQGKFIILNALHKTLMAALTCKALKLPEAKTRSIACAALTSNASIIKLAEVLNKQSKTMSQDQKTEFEAAPSNSLLYLTRCGVRDDIWLESIYMQHEKLDGSGFPRALKGEEISIGARILAIADTYVSYILPNQAMRQTYDPATALKRLYKRNKTSLDSKFIIQLVNRFGVIPPGSFVILKDGGVGIVLMQSKEKSKPVITKIGDKISSLYTEFNVTTTLPFTEIIRPPNNIPKKLFKLWAIYFSQHNETSGK